MRTLAAAVILVAAVAAGCESSHLAEADRMLTADHRPSTAVVVNTRNGSIEVVADPTRTDVAVAAHVRAGGASGEEAQTRLEQVVVTAERDATGALVIDSTFPTPRRNNDGVSFVVTVPDVSTADLRTSNGRITVRDVAGTVAARTSNGAVLAERIGGKVEARSSNGAITINDARGEVDVETSNGAIVMQSVAGPIRAESSNGRLELRDVGGPIQANSSNGPVTLVLRGDFPGTLEASTSNGGVTVIGGAAVASMQVGKRDATVAFKAAGGLSRVTTSNGSVRVEVK